MSRNVLVIEDDLDIAPLLTIQFTELTCTVKLAPGCIVGLAQAEANQYDFIAQGRHHSSRRVA